MTNEGFQREQSKQYKQKSDTRNEKRSHKLLWERTGTVAEIKARQLTNGEAWGGMHTAGGGRLSQDQYQSEITQFHPNRSKAAVHVVNKQ